MYKFMNFVCCKGHPLHCKNSGVKLTPAGVNTGPISNGVTLKTILVLFQHFSVFFITLGVILTPKSVEITPKWC